MGGEVVAGAAIAGQGLLELVEACARQVDGKSASAFEDGRGDSRAASCGGEDGANRGDGDRGHVDREDQRAARRFVDRCEAESKR